MTLTEITRGLLLGATALASTLAMAQPPGGSGRPGGRGGDDGLRPPGPPIIAALDTDRDGELSAAEIRNAAAALKTLDHNHDGMLDNSELDPHDGGPPAGGLDGPPGRPPGGGRPQGVGGGRPAIGHVLPPFVRDELALKDRQRRQIAELEKTVKSRLESILTAEQLRQFRALWNAALVGRVVAARAVLRRAARRATMRDRRRRPQRPGNE